MADEERTAGDQRGAEVPSENAFFAKLRSDADRRRESAQAFLQEQARRPGVDELLEDQQTQQAQLAEMERSLVRLRRSVLVANLCSGMVLIAFLAFVGYFYARMKNEAGFAMAGKPETGSAIGPTASSNPGAMSELVLASDREFAIRTNVDREYQLIVRQLYNTMRTIRQPLHGDTEVRNVATEHYIRFMSDVSRVIEKAAQDQPSEEILTAIVNIATVGQRMRKEVRIADLNVEMQNKLDQIKSVLRARDARLDSTD